jgi:hypothetical protein
MHAEMIIDIVNVNLKLFIGSILKILFVAQRCD